MLTAQLSDDAKKLFIKFFNDYGREVILPNPAPLNFFTISGELIFSMVSAQVLTSLGEGSSREWVVDLDESGLSKYISEGIVVRLSLLDPKDEIYLIIKPKK